MAQLLYRPLAHALSAVRQLSSALAQYMVLSWSMRLQYTKEEQAADVDRLQPHVSSTMPGASNVGTTPLYEASGSNSRINVARMVSKGHDPHFRPTWETRREPDVKTQRS